MIGVVGCGSWGTALAAVLARNYPAKQYFIWGRDLAVIDEINTNHQSAKFFGASLLPTNLVATGDLALLANNNLDLLICVPSSAFNEVLLQLKPYITSKHRVLWATKGLDKTSGNFLHQIVSTIFPAMPVAVLSGPSFAKEVVDNLPTAVSIASNCSQFLHDLNQAFSAETFRIYPSNDLIGVQLGGVMKNIFAVAAGVCDGLGYGANARAALLTRALSEMQRLALKINAQSSTMEGLAGLGDLILTCSDDKSRNRRFGLCLATGKSSAQAQLEVGVVEAVHNVAQVKKLSMLNEVDLPIVNAVYALLVENLSPQLAAQRLLARKLQNVAISATGVC
jgi:glycerol-3-phosphate dehydrogenase (NAD(P)+)